MKPHPGLVCRTVVAALVLCAAAVPGAAQLPSLVQFQVNLGTTDDQRTPEVAATDAGMVVVWQDEDIVARQFTPDGTPVSGDILVVEGTSPPSQAFRGVGMADDGSFLVVWRQSAAPGPDPNAGIRGRWFDASGTGGASFQVNSYTTNTQSEAAVTGLAGGGFVVVWTSNGSVGNDNSGRSVQGQLFLADGSPDGSQFQVNQYTTNAQRLPVVASDPVSGEFVVAWLSDGSPGDDTDGDSIVARRFLPSGTPLSDDFQVNVATTGNQADPKAALGSGGDVVISWRDPLPSPLDRVRRFDSSSAPLTSEIPLGRTSDVLGQVDGPFIAVGPKNFPDGPDSSGIALRTLGPALELGTEAPVNSYVTGLQRNPRLAPGPDGTFWVVWESDGSVGPDNDGFSIQARRVGEPLFYDGFGTGDTSGWAAVVE